MLWFRSCPRCKGDLTERSEEDGVVATCIQCGHELTPAEFARLRLSFGLGRPAETRRVSEKKAA